MKQPAATATNPPATPADNTGAPNSLANPAGQATPASHRPFRKGETCGICGLGTLDYNGLLDLECPVCGYTEGPGGGCT